MKKYLEDRGIYITYSQLVMRIIFDLVGFLLALLPAGLTLYLTDVWITSGTHMPTSWILGIIVCVFLIHFYQFYFVNYNSQMNADRMAGNYRQHLAQKILSSSIPAYESQNKARIQNIAVVCGFNRKFFKQCNSQQRVCDMQFTVVANKSNCELRWQGASYSGAHPVFVFMETHAVPYATSGSFLRTPSAVVSYKTCPANLARTS